MVARDDEASPSELRGVITDISDEGRSGRAMVTVSSNFAVSFQIWTKGLWALTSFEIAT